jgi:DUF1009 family protein
MGRRIGVIAGSGEFPLLAVEEASRRGWSCAVAGLRGEAAGTLEAKASRFAWIEIGRPDEALQFFKANGVKDILLAGKIDPHAYFRLQDPDREAGEWLRSATNGTPTGLIQAFFRYLSEQGFEVLDPGPFLAPFFCRAGVLAGGAPTAAVRRDAEFGWKLARRLADLDVGQTVLIKNQAVVAVEAGEGTDAAIRRAGELAGRGTVAVKVSRTKQDFRIDVPAIGLNTVRSLAQAGAAAMCLEAERVAFFQKEQALELADQSGIIVFARSEG